MIRLLKRYLKNYKPQAILGPFFKWMEALFELIVPVVMAKIIDTGIAGGDTVYIWRMGGILLLLAVCGLMFSLICQYFASRASQGVGTDMRNDVFRKILSFSHKEINGSDSANLVNVLTADINQLQTAVAMLIRLVVRAPFLVAGAVVMSFSISVSLSLVLIPAALLITAALALIIGKTTPGYGAVQGKLDRLTEIVKENLSGVRVIRAFSKRETEEHKFAAANNDFIGSTILVNKLSAMISPLSCIILNTAIILIIRIGGININEGSLTQGELIAVVNYVNQIILQMIIISNLAVIFTKAGASARRVQKILDTGVSISDAETGAEYVPDKAVPSVELRDVSFSYYGSGKNALEDISLVIKKGQHVGVIGGTGSGKSTLVSLIPRLYDAASGTVLVNGTDIKRTSLSSLRKKIGLVEQKPAIFSGTVRSNLVSAFPGASDADIEKALKISQAWSFVSKYPDGIRHEISEKGGNLSGGQKQRLSVARAVIRSPEILILDDSCSALDYITDSEMRKAIRMSPPGVTVITVSQRVVSIKDCDVIFVMDKGRIVGRGTHKELLESCGIYKEIYHSTGSGEADDNA